MIASDSFCYCDVVDRHSIVEKSDIVSYYITIDGVTIAGSLHANK